MRFPEHTTDSERWDVILVWRMQLILINKEEFFNVIDKMAHDAMDSGSPQNTMRDVTEEEVKEIYRKLW